MLTEKDYCDYDTCVALKELGYPVIMAYGTPTIEIQLYEAQKWLREKKLLHIVIDKLLYGAYEFSVVDILNYSEQKNGTANSYEEALLEGIKEAVELLKDEVTDHEEIVKGRLSCIDCIYNNNCEDVNDRCVANYIYEGEVVHLKNMKE